MLKTDVAAYVWPAYTGDEKRSRMFWKEGMGEWQSVKNSVPKISPYGIYPEPAKPLWGFVNEADPYVMQMQIDAATDHGINVFIYDWYWYDTRPFLEHCLDNGFLKAQNNHKMKFYLMWANHDANHLWNKELSDTCGDVVIWKGAQDRKQFEIIVKRVIEKYFSHPCYYKINGCPVFMIYELVNLTEGLGGIEETKRALDYFRNEVVKAGFPGLHLQVAAWNSNGNNLSGVDKGIGLSRDEFNALCFDSMTHYQFVHFTSMNRDYLEVLEDVKAQYKLINENYNIPYYPHVSVGWDNNPRFRSFIDHVCKNNTPENFENGLRLASDYLDQHPELHRLVTLNSWNEWTETSYLQPDTKYGYGYLEAVKRVFKGK
ncbi:MAG: hypothetical protein E7665_05945 [Ruminococcaceae bacterium]|nr:hypothetical protein [Oscillospiraceae bacterium]